MDNWLRTACAKAVPFPIKASRMKEAVTPPGARKLAQYMLIVGTRCAGTPVTMPLARKGYNVLGVDRALAPDADRIAAAGEAPKSG
jgi:hypothetical protein